MKDNINMSEPLKILNPSECEYYKDGDCRYKEDCEEYSLLKCKDIQKIGRCYLIYN